MNQYMMTQLRLWDYRRLMLLFRRFGNAVFTIIKVAHIKRFVHIYWFE
jgi:hypothetical protein